MWTSSPHASGYSGSGSFASSAIRLSSSSTSHGIRRRLSSTLVEARPELRLGGRLDALQRLERGRADRPAELVPALEAVPARLAVPEPVVPARDVAAAALEEDALCSRHSGLDGLAERPREVRVPEQRLASDQRGVAREARDDGDRAAVLRVDPEDRHAVVHRPLTADPVDADPGSAAAAPADACRPPPAPRRVDGTREHVRQRLDVRGERSGIGEPGDGGAARDARRAVVVRSVHEHRLGRDPGQLLHALAHGGRHVRAGEDEVDGDDRDRGAAVVEDERLRDHRVVDPLGEARTGRPAAVRKATRGSDVGACDAGGEVAHERSFLTRGRPARRTPLDAASSGRTTGSRAPAPGVLGRARR